ncbi:YndM family protein [Alkalihalophilus marmarensis]|uniref:YndM family protein n=1 Tax=Alkalihalophilus marmarensis TaxID=521377 RepID=UPI002E1F254C|nr:YndM family protein [Alkalihalophilus marmarensis]
MEHIKALLIKGAATLVILYLILGLGLGMAFEYVLFITLVLGIGSYIAGDLIILPKANNKIATGSDLGLAFIVVWLMGIPYGYSIGTMAITAIIAAPVVGVFEFFFHTYISNKELGRYGSGNRKWKTEIE